MTSQAHTATFASMHEANRTSVALHDDALRYVFHFLFSPPGLLNPRASEFFDSPWLRELRTKKAATLVSKQWHAVALPYLYENISLRNSWQVSLLSRTILSAPHIFGPLIKSLRVICYVPGNFVDAVCRGIHIIIGHCTSSLKLAFEGPFSFYVVSEALRNPNKDLYSLLRDNHSPSGCFSCPKPITQLTFFENGTHYWQRWLAKQPRSPPVPVALLSQFSHLTKLTINSSYHKAFSNGDPLEFPELKSLCLWSVTPGSEVPAQWRMPKLSQLRLLFMFDDIPYSYSNGIQFFRTYGPQLLYLDLGYLPLPWDTLHTVLDLCPSLGRLGVTLDFSMFGPDYHDVKDWEIPRAIPFVDIVVGGDPTKEGDRVFGGVEENETAVAFLQNIAQVWRHMRLIDQSLLMRIPDLPDILPPDLSLETRRTFDMFGLTVIQTKQAVWQESSLIPNRCWNAPIWEFPDTRLAPSQKSTDHPDVPHPNTIECQQGNDRIRRVEEPDPTYNGKGSEVRSRRPDSVWSNDDDDDDYSYSSDSESGSSAITDDSLWGTDEAAGPGHSVIMLIL